MPTIGSVEPFGQFYAREFPKLVSLAYAMSGSRMAAEDLVQEGMIIAFRNWETVGSLDRPGAWVRRVVLNRSASAFHRKKAEARAILRLAPLRGEPPASLSQETAEFWRAVRRLPKRQSQAVALHYLDGMTIAEIAEVMDCAPGTVKVHLHRGRKALAQELNIEEAS